MNIYFFIVTLILLLDCVKYFIRLILSSNYLLNKKNQKLNINTNKRNLTIIIPVYKEEKNIENSIKYFKQFSKICDVIYITTAKEKDNLTHLEIENQIQLQKTTNIYVDKCPNQVGTMATQITYIAKINEILH